MNNMNPHKSSPDIRDNTTMMGIDRETIEMIDLSASSSTVGQVPSVSYLQKPAMPRTTKTTGASLTDVFRRDGYGAAHFTPHSLMSSGGSSGRNMPSKLDYFDDSEDAELDIPARRKQKDQSHANSMDNTSDDSITARGITQASSKKRKMHRRPSRTASPSLFMTPAPDSFKVQRKPVPVPRKESGALRSTSSQALPSFGFQSCTIAKDIPSTFMPQTMSQRHSAAQPQLPPTTGIDHVDITASLNYVERQIEQVSKDIVQPVIQLTRMVKKLEFENASLRGQIHDFQSAVKKSVSEIHERHDEHEALIDGLSNSTLNPAGAPYGGPRYTAVKKPGFFQGMLPVNGAGAGGATAGAR